MITDLSKAPIKTWKCNDPRLPPDENVFRTPPDKKFLDSIARHGQLQAILMGHNDTDGWFLVFGRKRLLAIRQLLEDGKGDGDVSVKIAEGITLNEGIEISIAENRERSDNPISDYLAIKEVRATNKFATPKEIADSVNQTEAFVKNVEKNYATVPQWALDAALDGEIAPTTAIKVGKLDANLQVKCEVILKTEKKLTATAVDDLNKFTKVEMYAKLQPQLDLSDGSDSNPDGQAFFPRSDLIQVSNLVNDGKIDEAKELLKNLLDE